MYNNLHMSTILQEPAITFSPKFVLQVARKNCLVIQHLYSQEGDIGGGTMNRNTRGKIVEYRSRPTTSKIQWIPKLLEWIKQNNVPKRKNYRNTAQKTPEYRNTENPNVSLSKLTLNLALESFLCLLPPSELSGEVKFCSERNFLCLSNWLLLTGRCFTSVNPLYFLPLRSALPSSETDLKSPRDERCHSLGKKVAN